MLTRDFHEAESLDALGTAVGRLTQKEIPYHAHRQHEKHHQRRLDRSCRVRAREAAKFRD